MSIYEGCLVHRHFNKKQGRYQVDITFPSRKVVRKTYARYKMEKHLDRFLDPVLETVDHVDDDKTNDELGNLQLLTLAENSAKRFKDPTWFHFFCPICDEECSIRMWVYRQNQVKKGYEGPFCSRSCSSKRSRKSTR